jgi:16S rRNA (cytosine967-C5)-methyltransferase
MTNGAAPALSAVAPSKPLRRVINQAPSATKVGATLSHALVAASWVTHHVAAGASLPSVLRELAPKLSTSALKGACQDLSYQAQRQRARADALITGLTKKPFESLDAGVLALLRVSLGLMCDDVTPAAYPAHTVVDQAVTALPAVLACGLGKTLPTLQLTAHSNRNTMVVAGFVNGVLRTYLREQALRNEAVLRYPQAQWNHPTWWIERLKQDYPQYWQDMLRLNNRAPVMALRANARVHSAAQAQQHLAQHQIVAHLVPSLPNALVLEKPLPVEQIPCFTQGWYSVQDLAAQLCVDLLDIRDGHRVLDACAAPGGKTAHILERANVTLTALDNDPMRLDKVRATLQRLGRTFLGATPYAAQPLIELKTANATQVDKWWDGQMFDRIVLDAPCSASGVVRRHPDSRWLRRASDIASLCAQQSLLLHALWPTLAVNGLMLYVTCSVFKAEGEQQVAAFLKLQANAQLVPTLGHCIPLPTPDSTSQALRLHRVAHHLHASATTETLRQIDENAAQSHDARSTVTDTAFDFVTELATFPNASHDGFYYALLRKVA